MTQLAIEGNTQAVIADRLGVSTATVSRTLSNELIRDKIAYCRNEIIEKAYNESVGNVISVIKDYLNKAEDKDALMRREHGFKASVKILETMGIFPTQTTASFVTNILNVQQNNLISPLADKALSQVMMIPDTIYSAEDEDK